MRPPAWLLWSVAMLASAIAVLLTTPDAARARAAAQHELRSWRSTAAHAEELVALRSRLAAGAPVEESQATLAERVARVLADAGLPGSALSSLSPESQVGAGAAGDPAVIRRRATLTLAATTLPELGRFLDAWRSREPGWVVSNIDLSPEAHRDTPPTPGGDLPIRAVLTIESIAPRSGSAP